MEIQMKNVNKIIAATLITGGLVGTAFMTHADNRGMDANETVAISEVSVTINKAVEIALAAVPGTAKEAEFEVKNGKSIWEVEVVDATKRVFKLNIDAKTGEVLDQKIKDGDGKKRKHSKNKRNQDKA